MIPTMVYITSSKISPWFKGVPCFLSKYPETEFRIYVLFAGFVLPRDDLLLLLSPVG